MEQRNEIAYLSSLVSVCYQVRIKSLVLSCDVLGRVLFVWRGLPATRSEMYWKERVWDPSP